MSKAKLSKYYLWVLMVMIYSNFTLISGQNLKINPSVSTVSIFGTSNLHDWESKVGQISADFIVSESKQVNSLVVKIPVRSIKSGDRLMDKKTYETIDADKNPTIVFQLTEPALPIISKDNKDVEVTLTGNLTLAGVTKKISFKSAGKLAANGSYQFKASIPLKMTDFKMKPPTAMLGMVKAGDAVTLKLDVTILAQNMVSMNIN